MTKFLKVSEAVDASGLPQTLIEQAMESGELAFVRPGHARLIPDAELERFCQQLIERQNPQRPRMQFDSC